MASTHGAKDSYMVSEVHILGRITRFNSGVETGQDPTHAGFMGLMVASPARDEHDAECMVSGAGKSYCPKLHRLIGVFPGGISTVSAELLLVHVSGKCKRDVRRLKCQIKHLSLAENWSSSRLVTN